jgi:hypothetical protein
MESKVQMVNRPDHSSLSNQKFIEGRRRSQNVGFKGHQFKPMGGGFKFGYSKPSKQYVIVKLNESQNEDPPGLVIKTSNLTQRKPSVNVHKIEPLKIKEFAHLS